MGGLSPASILYDSSGNAVGVVQDGAIYRLQAQAKVANAAGTVINPAKEDGNLSTLAGKDFATEAKLEAVRVLLASLEGKDFATQTTLASLLSAFNAEDFASETTLGAFKTAFESEDFATETTLASVATEDTLAAIAVLVTSLDGKDFATQTTLASLLSAFSSEDFASETTLASLLGAFNAEDFATQTTLAALLSAFNAEDFSSETTLASLLSAFNDEDFASETTLTSIKDTDGIKKITDQLPAGTNEIGKVAQGTKAAGSSAWPQALYDASGNVVGVVLDDTVYRLQTDSKVAKKVTAGTLDHLKVLDSTGALKATLYTPAGDPVAFQVEASPDGLRRDFARQTGGSDTSDLRVDGSATPVDFTYLSDATNDTLVNTVGFVMVANSIASGSSNFAGLSALTNGVSVYFYDGTAEYLIGNLRENECFMHFASPGGYGFWALSKDQVMSQYLVGGVITLRSNSTDKIIVRVADDLSGGLNYFKCQVSGVKKPTS